MARAAVAAPDTPFPQALSKKFALPAEAVGKARQVRIDRDGIVYIRTDAGVMRLFDDRIAPDRSYRPLAGKIPVELNVFGGDLYYLFPDEFLSNRRAGKFVYRLQQSFEHAAVNSRGEALLARGNTLVRLRDGEWSAPLSAPAAVEQILAHGETFFLRTASAIYPGESRPPLTEIEDLTSAAFHRGGLVLGTTRGFKVIDPAHGKEILEWQERLPATHITALASDGNYLWAGTTRGVWRRSADGSFRYFASRRWLQEDEVIDLALDPDGNAYVLTHSALNKIEFHAMTLAEKARWYDAKIRQRHIRYGFCAELRLRRPGDITSAEMIDTDNDGTWSNYYMASQAFRFGATGEESARRNAWETFAALERLEEINPLDGFPSRTFERTGFKVSDPDRWHHAGDGLWDWKAHTSSDEIAAHMFGSAVLYETCAKRPEEKERIVQFITRIIDHILRHDLYLVDLHGKPTLWGRWNPEYVNSFPESIFDRRLNSAELIAMLQFGYAIAGKELYRQTAQELFARHGYRENILLPMSRIGPGRTREHLGITMGDEWNHSDDLLAFITYWVLHRYAFTDELRQQYARAIEDHWQIEKLERNPLWAMVAASAGIREFDLPGALWTLRRFPLDLISWSVANSHRKDITPMPPNFRRQQLEELLPPDERRMTRWNGQPFILDGGEGGQVEYAGDEFLLPYWMARYLKLIEPPAAGPR